MLLLFSCQGQTQVGLGREPLRSYDIDADDGIDSDDIRRYLIFRNPMLQAMLQSRVVFRIRTERGSEGARERDRGRGRDKERCMSLERQP